MKERLDQEESFQCKAPGQVGHSTPDSDVENILDGPQTYIVVQIH